MTQRKETSLWRAAFDGHHSNSNSQRLAYDNLTATLENLEQNVAEILTNIPNDCKGLTIHDVSHAHQLWDVASVLCGADYPINPSEGFLLGVAFLIHDAGLTAASYSGGIGGIRASQLYRDLIAGALQRANPNEDASKLDVDNPPKDVAEKVLFSFLRHEHATCAERLLEMEFAHPVTGKKFTLLPTDMSHDFAELAGKLAASHHWDVKRLQLEFPDKIAPPANYPGWEIDPLKLACILRAADACAIDERRAQTMAFIIQDPRGVSRDHWLFQKNLNPGRLSGEALVFSQKRAFSRDQMDSWWLAFDAVGLADRELRACNRLLNRWDVSVTLKAKRVEGAEDADSLAKLLHVAGWRPVDASARIKDPLSVIEKLGGTNLYGGDWNAPVRELIQNAADAIRARRAQDGYAIGSGCITVTLAKQAANAGWILTVEDDGIGMPEDVLTGEFLDFGSSLWRSDHLAELYPGLGSSTKFKPTGRFGIGFYSIFMIADDVKIVSRSCIPIRNDPHVLHFKNGVRGRAELRDFNETEDGPAKLLQSTIVRAVVKFPDWLSAFHEQEIGNKTSPSEADYLESYAITLEQLTFALDVKLVLKTPAFTRTIVNDQSVFEIDNAAFVNKFNRVFRRDSNIRPPIPEKMTHAIAFIGDRDESKTRGVVSTNRTSTPGYFHIGGLTVLRWAADDIQGIIEGDPTNASRNSFKRTEPKEFYVAWAKIQLSLIDTMSLTDIELQSSFETLWKIGVELGEKYFLSDWDGNIIYINKLMFGEGTKIFVSVGQNHPLRKDMEIQGFNQHLIGNQFQQATAFQYVLGLGNISHTSNYAIIDAVGGHVGAYAALCRAIESKGFSYNASPIGKYEIGTYIGPDGGVGHLKDPDLVRGVPIERQGMVIEVTTKPS